MNDSLSIFRLTSASQSQKVRPKTAQARRNPNVSSSGQIYDVSALKKTISDFSAANKRLKSLIVHLQGAVVSQSQRDLLYKDFEQDLAEDVRSLEKRLSVLDAVSKDVNKFCSPSREPFVCAEKAPDTDLVYRTKITAEREKLTQEALFNERKIVLLKMQLKLCHDRRDFITLRSNLNMFEGGGNTLQSNEEIENALKIQIRNIKKKQEYERARIEFQKSPSIALHDAASKIQSLWRGFAFRKKNNESKENMGQTKKKNSK